MPDRRVSYWGSGWRKSHHFMRKFSTLKRASHPAPLSASFTFFVDLPPPPSLERANLPIQAPQVTGGKMRTRKGKWLGQGHTALDGQLALEHALQTCRRLCPSHLDTLQSSAAQRGNQLGRVAGGGGLLPRQEVETHPHPRI